MDFLLQHWLLSTEHLVHYYHLSYELWNDISYSADNFETCCKTETGFHCLPKKSTYLVCWLGCCVKWFCCIGLIFVVRTILCCNVRSLLAAPSRFWVLFCVLFLNMCLCKLQIRAGCSELLQPKSMSLGWCVLHLEEVLKGLVFLWFPEPPKSIHVLTSVEFLWVSKMQHLELWVYFVH